MPRIPYKTDAEAGPPELVAAIRKRRGGRLGALDRILLYSPPFAAGWNELLGRVRSELAVPMPLRELAMCAVAVLNGADYELHHHGPIFLAQGGTASQLQALSALPAIDPTVFDRAQRAALQLAFEMTRQVRVSDATFDAARGALGSDQHLFELIGVIAAYNMVSRILVAVGIEATD
ncbi:MAG TPA: carboxymuconolactone decarboxylase family protein [Burkholderiaceae bacterium]|nr:carboxymuconolactone decarboxylase family protein [Burkholderiaceae bacterium]